MIFKMPKTRQIQSRWTHRVLRARSLSQGCRPWVVGLCLVGTLSAFGGQVPAEVRELLHQEESLNRTETETILQHAAQAAAAGVPDAVVLGRLREGLVKRATAAELIEALKTSQLAHQEAMALLRGDRQGRHRGRRPPETDGLHAILVRALESGLPREAFEDLFAGEAGPRELGAQRMQAIVEAGEMLHLAGMDVSDVRRFMLMCRERQVRRMVALRAARQAILLHRQGMEPSAILRQVWHGRD